MQIKYINTGSSPNKGDGDTLRTAFNKINANFAFISTATGLFPSALYNGTWTLALSSTGTVTLNGTPFVSGGGTTVTANGWQLTSGTSVVSLDNSNVLSLPNGTNIYGYNIFQADAVGGFEFNSFTDHVGGGKRTWTFGTDGTTIIPDNSTIRTQGYGSLSIKSDNADIVIMTDVDNSRSWTFGGNHTLKFPDNTIQTTAYLGTATNSTLGGVKIGTNLEIAEDGTLSATPQSDQALLTTSSVRFQNISLPGSGGDPYWNSVTVLLHGNNFRDYSPYPQLVNETGITIDNSIQRFGDGSYAFNDQGSVTEPTLVADFARFDFTVEGWFYFKNNTEGYQPLLANVGTEPLQGWLLFLNTDNTLNLYASKIPGTWNYQYETGYTPPLSEWVHITVERHVDTILGDMLNIYVNGTKVSTGSCQEWQSPTDAFSLGYYPWFPGGPRSFSGNIDEVRVTIGVARYMGDDFTPPIAPYPSFGYSPFTGKITFGDDTIQTTAWTGVGGSIVQQDTAPDGSTSTIWYDTVGGRSYVYYDSGWVDASPMPVVDTTQLTNNGYSLSLDSAGVVNLPTFAGSPSIAIVQTASAGIGLNANGTYFNFNQNGQISGGGGINNSIDLSRDITVSSGKNVRINPGSGGVVSDKYWTFGSDGVILPNLASIVTVDIGFSATFPTNGAGQNSSSENSLTVGIANPAWADAILANPSGHYIQFNWEDYTVNHTITGITGPAPGTNVYTLTGTWPADGGAFPIVISSNNYVAGITKIVSDNGTQIATTGGTWTFAADGSLTLPGDLHGAEIFDPSPNGPISAGHQLNITPASNATDKKFEFTIHQNSSGVFQNAALQLPTSENNKQVYLSFPGNDSGDSSSSIVSLWNQNTNSGPSDFNNAFNILANGKDIKLTAEARNGSYSTWTFDSSGNLTFPDGGRVVLHPYGNSYIESVDYGITTSTSSLNIFAGPDQKITLRANFGGTEKFWTFGLDGSLTWPDTSVQTGASISIADLKAIITTCTNFTEFKDAILGL